MEDEKENQNTDTQTVTDNTQKEQKTENKSEGTKGNEQSKGKSKNGIIKNDDGSITFESQEKFEEFASKMFRKGADKVEQNKTTQEQTTKQAQETQKTEEQQSQNQPTQDYTDKIALAMAKAGVDVQKVERAARLVNMSKVLENGVVDAKMLEDEINAVITEFPELKNTKEEEKQEKGFKFGATEGSSNSNQEKKKPVATKKWNRFNSL